MHDVPERTPDDSRDALGRTVIEAARRYTNAVTGDPTWEYMRALVNAVRAYDAAGDAEQEGNEDAVRTD